MGFRETYTEYTVEVYFGNFQVLKKLCKLSWEKDLKLRVVFRGMSFSHIGWLIPNNPCMHYSRKPCPALIPAQAEPWNPGVWSLWQEGVGVEVKNPRARAPCPSHSELTLLSQVK